MVTSGSTSKIDVGVCRTVDVSEIKPSKYNARDQKLEKNDDQEFIDLCNSIRENGLIEPIVVRSSDGRYEAVAGSRRLRALKHIGVKHAPTIVRKFSDNDVRIASLVENIHKSLDNDEKVLNILAIYKEAGGWDAKTVKSYLGQMVYFKTRGIKNKPDSRDSRGRPQEVFVPEDFKAFCARISYTPATQAKMINEYENELLAQEEIKKYRVFDEHPYVQQHAIREASHAARKEIPMIVQQAAHDLQTGVWDKDKETGKYEHYPGLSESVKNVPDFETNPVRAREEINRVGERLFQLITGGEINMADSDRSLQFASSKKAKGNMNDLVKYHMGPHDLAALQYTIIPLQHALTIFQEVLYDAVEDENKKSKVLKP